MKKLTFHIFLSCLLIIAASPFSCALAQDEEKLPQEAVDLSNQIIVDIYQDILRNRANYPGLEDFGEKNFFENRRGIYAIVYQNVDPKSGAPYHFGVTINTMDDLDFKGAGNKFNYGFPKINLKISGFQLRQSLRTEFDLMPLISKYGMRLAEYQQKFMPLRIFIEPKSEAFKVNQEIELKVILKNVSKRHMIVQSLSEKTLYFMFNDKTWGTNLGDPAKSGIEQEVLKAGEEVSLVLRGASFDRPQQVNISCFYRMSLGGVNPVGKASVLIKE